MPEQRKFDLNHIKINNQLNTPLTKDEQRVVDTLMQKKPLAAWKANFSEYIDIKTPTETKKDRYANPLSDEAASNILKVFLHSLAASGFKLNQRAETKTFFDIAIDIMLKLPESGISILNVSNALRGMIEVIPDADQKRIVFMDPANIPKKAIPSPNVKSYFLPVAESTTKNNGKLSFKLDGKFFDADDLYLHANKAIIALTTTPVLIMPLVIIGKGKDAKVTPPKETIFDIQIRPELLHLQASEANTLKIEPKRKYYVLNSHPTADQEYSEDGLCTLPCRMMDNAELEYVLTEMDTHPLKLLHTKTFDVILTQHPALQPHAVQGMAAAASSTQEILPSEPQRDILETVDFHHAQQAEGPSMEQIKAMVESVYEKKLAKEIKGHRLELAARDKEIAALKKALAAATATPKRSTHRKGAAKSNLFQQTAEKIQTGGFPVTHNRPWRP